MLIIKRRLNAGDMLCPKLIHDQLTVFFYALSEKKVQKPSLGCTFSEGKLLSILGANMYILGANMYILGAKYILGDNM